MFRRALLAIPWLRHMSPSFDKAQAIVAPAMRAAELQGNVRKLATFLESQRDGLEETEWQNLLKTHADSVENQLQALKVLDAEEATELCSSIQGTPFLPETKKRLKKIVSDTLLKIQNAPKTPMEKMQTVSFFGGYLTQKDREVLGDPSESNARKLDILTSRCLTVGLHYPTEQSYGNVLACAVVAGLATTSPQHFYDHLQEFKKSLKRRRAGSSLTRYVKQWPEDPKRLPEDLRQAATAEPLAPVSETDVTQVLNCIGDLRSSSKRVAPKETKMLQLAPSSSSRARPDMEAMMNMMQMMWQRAQGSARSSEELPLQFNTRRQPQNKPKPLKDAGPAQVHQPTEAEEDDLDDRAGEPEEPLLGVAEPEEPPAEPHEAAPKKTSPAAAKVAKAPLLALPNISAAEQSQWLAKESKKSTPKAKPTSTAKATGAAKAKAKAKAKGAAAKVKAKAAAKATPQSEANAAAGYRKPSMKRPAAGGWHVETRTRDSGQVDKHYWSPSGECFRLQHEARAAGYTD